MRAVTAKSGGAAVIESEHQARAFRGAAMHEGIDAERAMGADQPRLHAFDKVEARPPHQRAIAEHPEIAGGRIGEGIHCPDIANCAATRKRDARCAATRITLRPTIARA